MMGWKGSCLKVNDVLEIANFSKERASSDNAETNPKSPDESTKHSNDFMSEKLEVLH